MASGTGPRPSQGARRSDEINTKRRASCSAATDVLAMKAEVVLWTLF